MAIWFVSAREGGLQFSTEDGRVFHSADLAELTVFAGMNGFSDPLMASSTMDFASEEGFETDEGADELLEKVFRRIEFITEGVV